MLMVVVYMQYEAVHRGRHGYLESLSVSQEGPEGLWLSFRHREGYNHGCWGFVRGRFLKTRSLCFEVEAMIRHFLAQHDCLGHG